MRDIDYLGAVVRAAPVLVLRLAIQQTRTIAGAERIYFAEREGLARPEVLRAASRRIEELGGSQPLRTEPFLEVVGQAVESEALNPNRKPKIISAGAGLVRPRAGIGRRHF